MSNPTNWHAVDNWQDIPLQYQNKNVIHIKVDQSSVDAEHCTIVLIPSRSVFFSRNVITFLINLTEEDKTHLALCGVKVDKEETGGNLELLNKCLRDGSANTDMLYA